MKSTPFSDHLLGVVVVEKDKKKRGINEKTVCFEVEWLEVFQYEKQNIHPRISPQLGIEILCKSPIYSSRMSVCLSVTYLLQNGWTD